MRALLIDPVTKTVSTVEHEGDWKSIAAMISCRWITSALYIHTGDNTAPDVVYVDDEGLLTNPNPHGYFRLPGLSYPGTLAGKALVVGSDDDGNDRPALTSVDALLRAIEFIDNPEPKTIKPTITVTGW